MIKKGYWQYIQDNNNIINKFGMVTHFCSKCNNVYSSRMKVHIECEVDPYKEGYNLSEPVINFECPHCSSKTTMIDNHLQKIVKICNEKGYNLIFGFKNLEKETLFSCEGHNYLINGIPNYIFPTLVFYNLIKKFIPLEYKTIGNDNYLSIEEEFGYTEISVPNHFWNTELTEEDFNKVKFKYLKIMEKLVSELPPNPVVCGFECR